MIRRLFARARVRPVTAGFALLAPVALGTGLFGGSAPRLGASMGNPLTGAVFFVDAESKAAKQVESWKGSRPEEAKQLQKIARQPQADWFGDWNKDPERDVESRMRKIRSADAVPVLVAYNIPGRDCGLYSAGGADDAKAYHRWIKGFADGIEDGAAIVILEPDALAGADCLSEAGRAARLAMVRDAVHTLKQHADVRVYVDAGNPNWKSVGEIAALLKSAGVDEADGFSLNVSNTIGTDANIAYGEKIAAATGGKHFVVDTSRNGLGAAPKGVWCNPGGRALGRAPTTDTGHGQVDAFLWVKRPGESDGTCNGGPRAGQWWPEYAVGLAARAPRGI
jgi:endoglucanase